MSICDAVLTGTAKVTYVRERHQPLFCLRMEAFGTATVITKELVVTAGQHRCEYIQRLCSQGRKRPVWESENEAVVECGYQWMRRGRKVW